jgi:hypothetical protein
MLDRPWEESAFAFINVLPNQLKKLASLYKQLEASTIEAVIIYILNKVKTLTLFLH